MRYQKTLVFTEIVTMSTTTTTTMDLKVGKPLVTKTMARIPIKSLTKLSSKFQVYCMKLEA